MRDLINNVEYYLTPFWSTSTKEWMHMSHLISACKNGVPLVPAVTVIALGHKMYIYGGL